MSGSSSEKNVSIEQQEWQRIHERRTHAFPGSKTPENNPRPENVVGLSLSGGGLRSAMFNDGFLQGLSHCGLLRYVDYLCSVSGGGYIAAHLATRADKTSATGFHDDDPPLQSDSQKPLPRWALGRDPSTGKVEERRLHGVGRYLASKIALAPSFVWSVLLSALVFIGITGVVATLLALFWRSFDDPFFRVLHSNVLDFQFGGELAIAFYPALLVLIVWLTLSVFGWFRNSSYQLATNRIGMIVFAAAVLVSCAVFIGNGKTSAGGSTLIQLNHYAQWLAIFAAIFQVIAFIGRDMLFRSERDESKYWQKGLQKLATNGVVVFACFAMVHWMSREDISGYTKNRDPHLVRGDVYDWELLQRVSLAFQQWETDPEVTPQDSKPINNINPLVDIVEFDINLLDGWDQRQLMHPLIPLDNLTYRKSDPPRPQSTLDTPAWTYWERIGGLVQAYYYTRFTPSPEEIAASGFKDGRFKKTPKTIHDYYLLAHCRAEQQREFLLSFNQKLEQKEFSTFLMKLAGQLPFKVGDEHPVTVAQANLNVLSEYYQRLRYSGGPRHDALIDRNVASANRELLLAIFPNVIQDSKVASTLVVPPYDQAARLRWLLGWWTMLCIGICLSGIRNQTSTLYVYYRNRISKLFLGADHRYPDSPPMRAMQLHQVRPTEDGLPHPLFLAARMTPSNISGSYTVRNQPFVFSPIYCGDIDHAYIKTEEVGLPGVGQAPLMVGDAVTISGAAVTPFMTDNRALSIVLSFFGDGLGQWLIRRKSPRQASGAANFIRSRPWIGTLFCTAIFALSIAGWYALGFTFSLLLVAGLTIAAVVIARHYSGICQLIAALVSPHVVPPKKMVQSENKQPRPDLPESIGHVADGGFYDYLGVSELFRRKCSLIVVSDAGAHLGDNSLGPLAKMCTQATARYGVRIFDLDHESPIDFGRLELDATIKDERVVHQPYLVARLRYADNSEGLLVYCQMAITKSDPIEIQQIRHRFPSFPDEPTTNQFYTDDQVDAYRNLGHHIARRMCSEIHRWTGQDIEEDVETTTTQPLFDVVRRRLLTAYRLACYQERNYKSDDLFSEAIWSTKQMSICRSFDRTLDSELFNDNLMEGVTGDRQSVTERWLRAYENNGDVRAKYRHAVLTDINSTEDRVTSACAVIWRKIVDRRFSYAARHKHEPKIVDRELMSAHLAAIAVACHEIHAGRPTAIFQVGGREKLVAMASQLRSVLINANPKEEDLKILTSVFTPANEVELKTAVKNCIGELVELEKCTFHGAERVTTVSFSQCLVMMWGQLCEEQNAPSEQSARKFKNIADRIREEGVELAASKVRIWLERGLREKNLRQVVVGLENAWCITYLPPKVIEATTKTRRRKKSKVRLTKKAR